MIRRWQIWTVAVAFACLGVDAAGCARAKRNVATGVDRETRIAMNVLARFYGDYMLQSRGRPPKDVAAFRKYLRSRTDDLESLNIDSIDELLTSSRDGEPFVVVCGKIREVSNSRGNIWAAYETNGVDGKRMAVRLRGGVDELSPERFSEEFPGG